MRKSTLPRNLIWRGETIHARIERQGKVYSRPLETADVGVAAQRLEAFRNELIATEWGEKPHHTFNDAVARFTEKHIKRKKPATARRYVASIGNLIEDFDQVLLKDVSSALLTDFVDRRLEEDEVATATIIHDLRVLSVMFTRAEEWEWTDRNPIKPFIRARALDGFVAAGARERYLDHDEEVAVLEISSKRMFRRIAVAIDTGMRKEEQFSLMWSDVDLKRNQINIRPEVAKSGKGRSVPLLPRSRELLEHMESEWRRDGKAVPYVFTTEEGKRFSKASPHILNTWQALYRKAVKQGLLPEGRETPVWHDLRRTCGCRLLQDRRMSMETVCQWLGHSSVTVTEKHYAFLNVDQLHAEVARSEGKVIPLRRA